MLGSVAQAGPLAGTLSALLYLEAICCARIVWSGLDAVAPGPRGGVEHLPHGVLVGDVRGLPTAHGQCGAVARPQRCAPRLVDRMRQHGATSLGQAPGATRGSNQVPSSPLKEELAHHGVEPRPVVPALNDSRAGGGGHGEQILHCACREGNRAAYRAHATRPGDDVCASRSVSLSASPSPRTTRMRRARSASWRGGLDGVAVDALGRHRQSAGAPRSPT